MAEMVKHEAAVACYGRWDDQAKAWDAAKDMLGIHVEGKIVADVIVDTPEEIEALPDEQEVVVPVENVQGPVVKVEDADAEEDGKEDEGEGFVLTKGYIVKDEESYAFLPESYRSVYGEWGTEGLEESLPWLAVEFDATPAKDLVITVEGPEDFTKEISYPDVDKEVTLLTLNAEELGTEIVEGIWKVTVNGYTMELEK